MHAKRIKIGGKAIPKACKRFALFNAEGKRCMWKAEEEGVDVGDFDVSELAASTILDRWGPGTYRVQYLGEKDGRQRALGSRIVTVFATAPTPEAPPAPPLEAGLAGLDPAFRILDAIDRRAAATADRDRQFLSACLGMAMQRQDDGMANTVRALATSMTAMNQRLEALTLATANAGRDDDDDDDDDEDEDDDDEPRGGGPFKVGEPIADTAIAETLNGLAATLTSLAPTAQALLAAKVAELAAEAQARAQAKAHANGSTPPPAEAQQTG